MGLLYARIIQPFVEVNVANCCVCPEIRENITDIHCSDFVCIF